jgi:hypothetical protein
MRLVVVLAALGLGGCYGAGTRVTPQQLAYFVPHQTTSSEIRAVLGEPNGFATERDGSAVMIYNWYRTTLRPEDFIPVFGRLVAGTDTAVMGTTIFIGRDGTYQGVSRSTGQIPAGQLLAAP